MLQPFVDRAIKRSGGILLARVENIAGLPVTQITISSIAYTVTDLVTRQLIGSGALTPADVIFDSLQNDATWTEDDVGYNFRWVVPASLLTGKGNQVRVSVKLTPVTGEVFYLDPCILNLIDV